MFDILVYLFERYIHADACPESDQLAHKLSAAGFEDGEITEALEWLAGLRRVVESPASCASPSAGSIRLYAEEELIQLSPACRGFLAYLENTGILNSSTREMVIERAMALDDFTITLDRLKVIVLIVLWQKEQPMDTLIVDELLSCDSQDSTVLH